EARVAGQDRCDVREPRDGHVHERRPEPSVDPERVQRQRDPYPAQRPGGEKDHECPQQHAPRRGRGREETVRPSRKATAEAAVTASPAVRLATITKAATVATAIAIGRRYLRTRAPAAMFCPSAVGAAHSSPDRGL